MVDKVGLSSTSVVGSIGVGFINYIFLKVFFLLALCTYTLTFDLFFYTQLHLFRNKFFFFPSLFSFFFLLLTLCTYPLTFDLFVLHTTSSFSRYILLTLCTHTLTFDLSLYAQLHLSRKKKFLFTLCTHTLTFDLLYTQLHLSQVFFLFSLCIHIVILLSSARARARTHTHTHTHTHTRIRYLPSLYAHCSPLFVHALFPFLCTCAVPRALYTQCSPLPPPPPLCTLVHTAPRPLYTVPRPFYTHCSPPLPCTHSVAFHLFPSYMKGGGGGGEPTNLWVKFESLLSLTIPHILNPAVVCCRADTEIKVPSVWIHELTNVFSLKPGTGQNYSHAYFAHCQEFLSCPNL